jgi:hypothetical protein
MLFARLPQTVRPGYRSPRRGSHPRNHAGNSPQRRPPPSASRACKRCGRRLPAYRARSFVPGVQEPRQDRCTTEKPTDSWSSASKFLIFLTRLAAVSGDCQFSPGVRSSHSSLPNCSRSSASAAPYSYGPKPTRTPKWSIIQKHCFDCHNRDDLAGDRAFDRAELEIAALAFPHQHIAALECAVDALGEPPDDRLQPTCVVRQRSG